MVSATAAMRRDHSWNMLAGMFSEEVRLLPPIGAQIVARALIQPARAQVRDRQYDSSTVEEIDVRLAKDSAAIAANGIAIGGIDAGSVAPGLALVRDGEPDGRLFLFRFKLEETPDTWLLRFEFEALQQIGMKHVRK